MSSLQYYNDAGAGEERNRLYHYSQAVVVGDTVKLAGQGGWTPENALDANDGDGQVELAFRNVERVLETVGLGWDDVYSVRTYHTSLPLSMAKTVETDARKVHTEPQADPDWDWGVPPCGSEDVD